MRSELISQLSAFNDWIQLWVGGSDGFQKVIEVNSDAHAGLESIDEMIKSVPSDLSEEIDW